MLENPTSVAAAARNEGVRTLAGMFNTPEFTAQGLALGAGCIVARALTDQYGRKRLDLIKDFDRAGALLSVAYHRPIGAWEMGRLQAASEAWAMNDLALAHTILAQARFGRLEGEGAAERLRIAEKYLSEDTTARELLKALDLLADDWPLDKASPDDPVRPGWPAGTPGGLGGRFRPKNDAGVAGVGHNGGPPMIPEELPISGKVRSAIIKASVKWLVRAGLAAADITAPEVVIPLQLGIEVGSWAYPYIKAYFDGPKSLQELQDAVADQQSGYDVHHIVEQTSAEQDGFPREQIDAPDNLVRISTLKHWELNSWFQTRNDKYGGLTPRQYLKGKSWAERTQVGLEGLKQIGVLAP